MTLTSDEPSATPPASAAIEDALNTLAARVVALRQEAKMTQRELAVRAGWSQSNLSKLERGEHRPRIDTVLRLQHALGLGSIEELFGELPPPDVPTGRLLGIGP